MSVIHGITSLILPGSGQLIAGKKKDAKKYALREISSLGAAAGSLAIINHVGSFAEKEASELLKFKNMALNALQNKYVRCATIAIGLVGAFAMVVNRVTSAINGIKIKKEK